MTDENRYRVSPWSAEFVDRDVERAFRRHVREPTVRHVKLTVLAAGVFFLIFAVTDYLDLGATPVGLALIAVRLAIAVAALGVFFWVLHRPAAAVSGVAVTLFEVVILAAFGSVLTLRDAPVVIYGMSMVTLLTGIYLLIPNRLPYMLVLSLAGSVGFFLLISLTLGAESTAMLDMVMLIVLMNLFGAGAARQLAMGRREQYRLLALAQRSNRSLIREVQRRHRLEVELERQASTDALTGLANRRSYLQASSRVLEQARRHGHTTAVMVVDLDHFKWINDTWGHAAGDAALTAVAEVLQRELRAGDLVGRIGGEEFAVTLPESEATEAVLAARRLLAAITEIRIADWPQLRLSATIGVALATGADAIAKLLARADGALYEGKRAGRGRVVLASGESGVPSPSSRSQGDPRAGPGR